MQQGDTPRLFNLADDVGEQRDLAGAMPEQLEHVQRQLSTWQQEMRDAPIRGPFRNH